MKQIYVFANNILLNQQIIDSCNFQEDDDVYLFNVIKPYKFIKKYLNKINFYVFMRDIHRLAPHNEGVSDIKRIFFFGNEANFNRTKILLEKRELIIITEQYVKETMNMKSKPFSSIMSIFYLINKYKKEINNKNIKIIYVGFTSMSSTNNGPIIRTALKQRGHDSDEDRKVFIELVNKYNIKTKYCAEDNGVLIDI